MIGHCWGLNPELISHYEYDIVCRKVPRAAAALTVPRANQTGELVEMYLVPEMLGERVPQFGSPETERVDA
ncbi:hypothetical protein DPMN_091966 [Dreissena polymorpha]|uniref:Uncharacterized protein n=1 Tax=Dreissena polymorpha TaxID=45954 RepID=A0A9D4L0N2_DREPO|nr:hypothetical protein DPMN_091966 [Dreissena polymorpha]